MESWERLAIERKNLLLVEDDEILRSFLQACLSQHGYHVECLPDGEGIPKLLEQTKINLIVLDVLLPGKNGLYWLKWLRQYHSHIPVIMASVRSNEDERLIGLENGAKDYLVKPFRDKELLIKINNIMGMKSISDTPSSIEIGNLVLDVINNSVQKNGEEFHLTLLETNILKLLYLNAGAVVSRDEIMEQLKGSQHNPLDRSIDIHINKLRKKIEDDPATPTFIRTIRGKGYCLHLSNFRA
ncbi:response regulator transcription factor [Thiothrix lacustris]|uniref:response regulator transcription factor n=1 Tax=Thiothrix lacustris TaxID=525917 RepID=UPI0027E54D9A|nr:response regulator transcription factor [Thiothrix lacustris]WMP19453.1 response regulator transcription factor [Thiothrix lacustris]